MEFEQDYSGINSLRGFAFQIKVFVSYMLDLKADMQLEFETIEDVNLKKIKTDNIDENSENFISNLLNAGTNQAIQVKRTTITKDVALKILLNWIMLESSDCNVSKYILLTEDAYNNKDIIFEDSVDELFQKILKSSKKSNATVTKVKSQFKDDFERFEKVVNQIKEKYEFLSIEDIDKNIDNKCALHFRKVANDVVYGQRLKELMQHKNKTIIKYREKLLEYNSKTKCLQKVCTDRFGITVLLMLAWMDVIFSKSILITNW